MNQLRPDRMDGWGQKCMLERWSACRLVGTLHLHHRRTLLGLGDQWLPRSHRCVDPTARRWLVCRLFGQVWLRRAFVPDSHLAWVHMVSSRLRDVLFDQPVLIRLYHRVLLIPLMSWSILSPQDPVKRQLLRSEELRGMLREEASPWMGFRLAPRRDVTPLGRPQMQMWLRGPHHALYQLRQELTRFRVQQQPRWWGCCCSLLSRQPAR